jgi:hypothetical protein
MTLPVPMKALLMLSCVCLPAFAPCADQPSIPKKIVTTTDFRQLLLATKWSWRNVSAGVPDRECIFMADGTFRHPHFVAQFKIMDINTVELHKKGGKAVLTFDKFYTSFEAIDFEKHRITGRRL